MSSRHHVHAGYWFTSTESQLPAANIDANYFTHLFCGYARIDAQTYKVTIDPSEIGLINRFTPTVRLSNYRVKTLLSIGGDKDVFANMASEPTKRDTFIESSISIARTGEFDGLDLQWFFPSSQNEMDDFASLLCSWHRAVVKEAKEYHRTKLLLVTTVSNLPYLQYNIQYPVDAIIQTLDWVNLISYDFYTPTSSRNCTGPSSAFYNPRSNSLSVNSGIGAWIKCFPHLPSEKIVFGISFHGWAWKLANPHQHEVFSKADGPATGDNISSDGRIDYSNIIRFIEENQAENVRNDEMYVIGYTFHGSIWIAYENEDTIPQKIRFARSHHVRGYFAWNIAADDNVNTLANAAQSSW